MEWHDLGPVEAFQKAPVTLAHIGKAAVAISYKEGAFGAISGICNHAGGPLGEGHLDGDFIQCPWHGYKFHRVTGLGEPGFEDDSVPRHDVKVENGRLYVSVEAVTRRHKMPHLPHPLERNPERADGPIRVVGISTTNMDPGNPRYSTSEALLDVALEHSRTALGCETRILRLRDLKFRACEGYYSKSARACTWPCSITQMDDKDEMTEVYEALVHWSDVVLVATPIRWGAASSLFFKMAERLNCVQNQITIKDRVLIRNKVAGFIVTGGQDNVQAVAGHMLLFFSELGFYFPQFPFIAHSRGWSAEDMEMNVEYVMRSEELRKGAMELAARSVSTVQMLLDRHIVVDRTARGGRKANRLVLHAK